MYDSYLVSFRVKGLNSPVSLDIHLPSSRNIRSLPLFNNVFLYAHKTVKVIQLQDFNQIYFS